MNEKMNILPVEGVQVAIVKQVSILNEENWSVYLINHNDFEIDNILVVTKGYGNINGEEKKTSVLRHMIDNVSARSVGLIELIQKELFVLNNEFWVSYFVGKQIYDKKFVFVEGSINDENLVQIPFMEEKGVLHV